MRSTTTYEIPISSIAIPGVDRLRTSGLIVVVGPNSSGKTQFLRDIYARVTAQARSLVVCRDIKLRKPSNFDAFVDCLVAHGAIEEVHNGANVMLRTLVPHFGSGQAGTGDISLGDANAQYAAPSSSEPTVQSSPSDSFLRQFGPLLSTVLFLENRLAGVNPTNSFDYASTKPTNEIQALHLDPEALAELRSEIASTFGKSVGVDSTRGQNLGIKISDSLPPESIDWSSPESVRHLRGIESEGDGLRSYCAVCVALLLGDRPITLIDEPEICLHAPQEEAMGRLIGRLGSRKDVATFLATHSSHVLRGILDSAGEFQILRLVRQNGQVTGHIVDRALIDASLRRPAARSEVILEGIFADAVTIVESDTDRVVYQDARSAALSAATRDTYFAEVGGIGGIVDSAKFYRALNIPVAVIADLDLICVPQDLQRIAEQLMDAPSATAIRNQCDAVLQSITTITPSVTEEAVTQELARLSTTPLDWTKLDDQTLITTLRKLANDLDRKRRLKRGGVSSFAQYVDIKSAIEALIDACAVIGLFLVPVGELEWWSPDLMKEGPSKHRKAEWANAFVQRIREDSAKATDIMAFMRKVEAFHDGASIPRRNGADLAN